MRIALAVVLLLLVVLAVAMARQHQHYFEVRRGPVQDRQALLHPREALHVLMYLEVAAGSEVLDAMRALRSATDAFEGAAMVYAGQVLVNGLTSAQVTREVGTDAAWDAVALVELPSREAYAAYRSDPAVGAALAGFSNRYVHGLQRPRLFNLALPQLLLGLRSINAVRGWASPRPFEPAAGLADRPDRPPVEALLEAGDLGADAVVVANLLKNGSQQEQSANRDYGLAMMSLMAEVGNGPMHMGPAVALEGDAEFDQIALVYYPGTAYFHAMATSGWFQGIVGDKQLGDTQASITAPILDRL